ncbi:ADP,ATP carrier protein 1 [Astathelohania contejeani]|uniref:ADP,ATP carrier protein n=1 Tax=Astathelohania contejeani TaxID=164912 RepID=A0ABQ7I075_9MICR|nr:ADP,ATP carrier protein 1 [Thelohania contejeani]
MNETLHHNTNRIPLESEIENEANTPGIFGRIFRVAKIEIPKFVSLSIMFYFIALVFSLMKDLKDSVIIDKQGNAAIAPLKMFFVTPISILAVLLIQKALTKYTTSQILFTVTLIFGSYFLIYGIFIIRWGWLIEPDKFWGCDKFGGGKMAVRKLEFLYSPMLTINAWTASLLYVTSELWGNLVLTFLFLSYSNDVCPPRQSLRFTPLYFIISNIGLMTSGCFIYFMAEFRETKSYAFNTWVMQSLFIFAGVSCFIILLIHRNLEKNILNKPLYIIEGAEKKKKAKANIGFMEGLKTMSYSKVLLSICGIVFFFNIGANMCDTCYKAAMQKYSAKANKQASTVILKNAAKSQWMIGGIVIVFLITPLTRVIEKGFWTLIGIIPIVAVGGVGSLMLILAILNTSVDPKGKNIPFISSIVKGLGYNENVKYEVNVGWLGSALFKITKYAAFDICKEAISVKIGSEYRAKAKGIFDGIVGKLGKTGSSILFTILYAIYDTNDARDASVPLLVINGIGACLWITSVIYLGKKYNEAAFSNSEIDLDMKVEEKANK